MVDTLGKIAMALIVLTAAGMVLRNSGGTAQVINSVAGGYGSLLQQARGWVFKPQALPEGYPTAEVNLYETSQGRAVNPLGNDPHLPGTGQAQTSKAGKGLRDPSVDLWRTDLVYERISGNPNMVGFGEAPQPARVAAPQLERIARFFVTYFAHMPYQGGQELRECVGGHVIIRRMPNAGQAQGAMLPLQPQINQRRVLPPAWDAGAFLG